MGIGHRSRNPQAAYAKQQLRFFKTNWRHTDQHGGTLRQKAAGRGRRPLSTRSPVHAVFKIHRYRLREKSLRGYRSSYIVHRLIKRYSKMFFVKIEQVSIQGDHIHILLRTNRRSLYHHFFRVLSGQIAQVFAKEGLLMTDTPTKLKTKRSLWIYRPFSRVVKGYRGYRIVMDYIRLNELEARGRIPYRKTRLKGLSMSEWNLLWTAA